MRFSLIRTCAPAVCAAALVLLLGAAPDLFAQGGEPLYFAIRGARVVPVSGPPMENATVVISRGIITAVGKDIAVPPEAWVIDGKGLTVYPGLVDSFTDVGIPAAAPSGGEGGGPRRAQETSRGPQDRPGSTPWRSAADEVSLSRQTHRILAKCGIHHRCLRAKGRVFSRTGSCARSRWRACRRSRREIARGDSRITTAFGWFRRRFSRFADGRARLRASGLAGHGLEHQGASPLRKKSSRHGASPL